MVRSSIKEFLKNLSCFTINNCFKYTNQRLRLRDHLSQKYISVVLYQTVLESVLFNIFIQELDEQEGSSICRPYKMDQSSHNQDKCKELQKNLLGLRDKIEFGVYLTSVKQCTQARNTLRFIYLLITTIKEPSSVVMVNNYLQNTVIHSNGQKDSQDFRKYQERK